MINKIKEKGQNIAEYAKTDSNAAISLATASGIVVLLTTTLVNTFAWPGAYVALVLSLISGTQIIKEWYKNMPKFIILSLIIFHTARGGSLTLSIQEDRIKNMMSSPGVEQTKNLVENSHLLAYNSINDNTTTNRTKKTFSPWM